MTVPDLDPAFALLLEDPRWATLTTLDHADGRPRSVPICFVLMDGALWSPLDDKPKANADPLTLRRVRNLAADPRATILVHRWDEDWSKLAFVEFSCLGAIVEPSDEGTSRAVDALRAKYPQYAAHRLDERPLLRFRVQRSRSWPANP